IRAQAATPAVAPAEVSALQQQLSATQAQLADVKTAQAAADANIVTLQAPPSGATVIPSLPNGKPAFATADGRFTANIRAIVMFDGGLYMQKTNLPATTVGRDLNDGTNFRRARFGIDGKLFKDFDYALIYEFGGSGAEDAGHIQEAWVQYTAFKPWRIRLGAFEPNIGLAAAVSTSQMPIMERPAPAEVARNVAAGDSRSALQFQGNGVWGEGDSGIASRWFLSTAVTGNTVGTINSTGSATAQPVDEQQAWIGRVAFAPFSSTDWQAHFGLNAQYVIHPNAIAPGVTPRTTVQLRDRPELRLDATRLVDTGAIDARHVTVLGAEAGVTIQNFLIEGEYFKYGIDRRLTAAQVGFGNPKFDGWYVQGAWVLTGESRPYNPTEARFDAPKMAYNFNPEAGTWGALELVARYSDLSLDFHAGAAGTASLADAIRGGEQKIATLGVNWYLNPDIRMMLDYQHVDVSRLNAAGVQIGQTYNALAARAQFTF
ncbi:OprO/OprP family phosphate-selective porin, partial [Phenylobacterium sp.]|uniref:OprO/OprP family phosphate-selective porin n=1 Tax=Phenylobacterium sp. TaxID=1871053 RepID=UPI002DF30E89|nr:porin [Phenylobacterium sp.]